MYLSIASPPNKRHQAILKPDTMATLKIGCDSNGHIYDRCIIQLNDRKGGIVYETNRLLIGGPMLFADPDRL